MALDEATSDRLAEALPQAIQTCVQEHDSERMVTRSLVMFESINGKGERTMSVFPGPDMRCWDILGMVRYLDELTGMWMERDGL